MALNELWVDTVVFPVNDGVVFVCGLDWGVGAFQLHLPQSNLQCGTFVVSSSWRQVVITPTQPYFISAFWTYCVCM